jgi:hypothetical protein
MTKRALNEKINITGWTFRNIRGIATFPSRMEYNGVNYTFSDGLQYLIKKGESVKRIFDMTDGLKDYRLICDENQNDWTLVAITEYA